MLTRTMKPTGWAISLALVAGFGATTPAAIAEDQMIEEVVVTGSRIKRSDVTSISPVSVLSSEELSSSGNLTLENFLQDVPSTLGGADYGSSVNNGNPGLATVQLRGLGPNRTLVLLNGQRPASAATDGIADLNMIPTAIIDRIEVLRDGASTVYGSDAIAGVINIITKNNFEGFKLDLGYDVTGEDDGEQYGIAATWGGAIDRGHMLVSAQYTERNDISQADRSFSACPFFERAGSILCGGSGTTTPAQVFPTAGAESDESWVVDGSSGAARTYDSALDAYNFAADSIMVTPQEVYSLFASAEYLVLEDSSFFGPVNATMEAGFTNRESNQLMAAVGTFWSPEVPASHPNNPFGDALCAGNPNCSEPQSVFIARRLRESGGRSFLQDAQSWRLVFGLDGEFSNGWNWATSYNYADWTDSQRDGGRAVQPRIEEMLDPDLCAASADGCPGVWNPFAANSLTAEHLRYGTVAVNKINRSRMRVAQLNIDGDFMGKFELPGGEPLWAVGYERRSEEGQSLPDGGSAIGAVFSTPGEITEGHYSVDEIYGEISLPILSGVKGAEVLTLEASVRWSDYNFVSDSDTNTKVAIEWAPIEDIRFRAVYAEGFRAPNISERFLGVQRTAASYADPCNGWQTSASAAIVANCGPGGDNLPVGFSVDAPQATTLEGGNEFLEPETSESINFGIVITPSALPDLTITIDYYDIEIDDAVGTAGTGNVINNCYNSVGFSDPLCAFIVGAAAVDEGPSSTAPNHRNALNQVTGVLLNNQNLSTFETKGLDFQIDYGFDTSVGRLDLRAVGTHMQDYNYLPFIGGTEQKLAGNFGIDPYNKNAITAFPEWAVNYSVSLTTDNWGATLMAKWLDETEDALAPDPENLAGTADSVWYFDVQGYYEINDMIFTLGVRNLTDEEAPYVTNYDDMNTLHYTYDTAGRYYYTRFSFKF